MSVGPCLLVVPSDLEITYYLLESVSPKEYRYLNSLENIHAETVSNPGFYKIDESRVRAYYYVAAALGYVDEEYLATRGRATKENVSVLRKWEDTRVDSLRKVNEAHVGRIHAVFSLNNSPM